ncbi:hypothetical protein B0H14DRAFT_2625024 [Mycena olivaceomarginata]|nr:hypothetical protein B0H14DRAFT_2625024 [Mycena olivaceomarginata]
MACFRSCRQLKCYYGLNPLDLLSGNQFLASWSSLESGPLILPAQTLGAYAGSQRTSLRLCDSLRATYDHRGSAETAGARRNSTLVLSLRDQVVNIACTAEGVRICRIPADLLRSAFFCAPTPPELSPCLQAPSPSTLWSPPSNTGRLAAKRTFSVPTPPELSSCLQAPSPSTLWSPPSNTGRLAAKCTFSVPTPPELSSCLQAPSPSKSWSPPSNTGRLAAKCTFSVPTPPELSSCLQAPSPSKSWSPPSNTGRLAVKCTFSVPTPPELSSCLQAPSPSTSWFPAIEYQPACCEAHFLCSRLPTNQHPQNSGLTQGSRRLGGADGANGKVSHSHSERLTAVSRYAAKRERPEVLTIHSGNQVLDVAASTPSPCNDAAQGFARETSPGPGPILVKPPTIQEISGFSDVYEIPGFLVPTVSFHSCALLSTPTPRALPTDHPRPRPALAFPRPRCVPTLTAASAYR